MLKNELIECYGPDAAAMTLALCEAAGLAGLIAQKNAKIGLKPNLVSPSPASGGATTHPEVVGALIEYLQANGFLHISIIEGAWVGASTARAFQVCGYTNLSKKYGVPLIDTQQGRHHTHACAGMDIDICDAALEVDFMINLPVLKGHCQTRLTCALKNNKGILPNAEKRRFHTMGLHKPIAHLNTVAKNDFILVDGICGDLDFEEGGNPVQANRLYAARDAVLCDAYAAAQLGMAARDVAYIGLAEALGAGSADLEHAVVTRLSDGHAAPPAAKPCGKARHVAPYMHENAACSACAAALTRALCQLTAGEVKGLPCPVCIGQGWQGHRGALGVGRCTGAFRASLPGCPPSAKAIAAFLRTHARL